MCLSAPVNTMSPYKTSSGGTANLIRWHEEKTLSRG